MLNKEHVYEGSGWSGLLLAATIVAGIMIVAAL